MRTHEEFLAEGRALAQAYVEGSDIGGNTPDTLVEKCAREKGLNAEQIRRLGRATNVALFSVKYAAAAGQTDRRVEFPTVDPEAVITALQAKEPEGPVKLAADAYPSFVDPNAAPVIEKVAEAQLPELTAREIWRERDNVWRLQRELPSEVGAIQEKWASCIGGIIPSCRRVDHDHLEFEKNAVAVLGEHVVPELNAVRARLKMPALTESLDKYAAAREFLVGEDNALTERLKTAMDLRQQYGVQSELLSKVEAAYAASRAVGR